MKNNKQSEFRTVKFETEVRAEEGGGKKLILRGYPILFNEETTIYHHWYGEIKEVILPTAMKDVKLEGIYLLLGHNPDNVLGRVGVNMRAEIDETGVFFECELPNTQLARDTYNLVESGILDGMSFGFVSNDKINEATKTRTITHFEEVYEFTITPFPAYEAASVVAKKEKDAPAAADIAALEARRREFIKNMEAW